MCYFSYSNYTNYNYVVICVTKVFLIYLYTGKERLRDLVERWNNGKVQTASREKQLHYILLTC